ncbi:MAG: hypothetical protein AD073_000258 [Mycoplasmataceae bacterium]|nr:MAG: hypothetical protein AD073_000258 [Mycoplasmataceae bacterium]
MNKQTIFNTTAIIALTMSIYNLFKNPKERIVIVERKIAENSSVKETIDNSKENKAVNEDSTIINENIQYKTLDEVNERIESIKKARAEKESNSNKEEIN